MCQTVVPKFIAAMAPLFSDTTMLDCVIQDGGAGTAGDIWLHLCEFTLLPLGIAVHSLGIAGSQYLTFSNLR